MNQYTIEFACTGNRGRSTVAEVIGNWHLQDRNLETKISAISSGTEVEKHSRTDFDIERVIELIGWSFGFLVTPFGQEYGKGVFSPQEVKDMETIYSHKDLAPALYRQDPKLIDLEYLRKLAVKGLGMLRAKEAKLRDWAITEVFGKYKDFKISEPKQMVANPEVDLVLGMAPKHVKAARNIYILCPETKIDTLPGYCGYPQLKVPDLIRSANTEDYITNIKTLSLLVPSAIDLFVEKIK